MYGNGTFGVSDHQMLVFSSRKIFINFFTDQPYVSPFEGFWVSTQRSDRTLCYTSLPHQSFLWLCITHKQRMLRRVLLVESFQDSSPVPMFPTFYGILEKHVPFLCRDISLSLPFLCHHSHIWQLSLRFFQFHVSHLSLWPTNPWSCPPMT